MTKIFPLSSIFQQRHQKIINNSKMRKFSSFSKELSDEKINIYFKNDEEIDLFTYNLGLNDCLFFGGVNAFNEYIRDSPQIHLTSAYIFNKKY